MATQLTQTDVIRHSKESIATVRFYSKLTKRTNRDEAA